MEVENAVFGSDAESKNILESEEFFNFNNRNKKTEKIDIDNSAKELTDFFETVSQDVPDPSEEEINLAVEKIIAKAYPEKTPSKSEKSNKTKKVTFRVLFVAALLSVIAFSCLFVTGDKHNITLENGFITFAKETVKVIFFGERGKEAIPVDVLLADLEYHGFKDILFPQEFVNKSNVYKFGMPEYGENGANSVSFDIYSGDKKYNITISETDSSYSVGSLPHITDIETLNIEGVYFYIVSHESGDLMVRFVKGNCRYSITTDASYSELVKVVKSII